MDMKIYILLTISILNSGATALKCYDCTFLRPRSSNKVVEQIMNLFTSTGDCKVITEDDDNDMKTKTCPRPQSGHVAECVAIKGDLSFTASLSVFGEYDVDMYVVHRDCTEVPRKDRNSGCHKNSISASLREVISRIDDIPGVSTKKEEFSGITCSAEELVADEIFSSGGSSTHSYNVLVIVLSIAVMLNYNPVL